MRLGARQVPTRRPCRRQRRKVRPGAGPPVPFPPLLPPLPRSRSLSAGRQRPLPHLTLWGQRVALRHSSFPSESCSVVSPCSGHHGQAAPVVCKYSPSAWSDAVSLQDFQAPGPVQGVVCFGQVQVPGNPGGLRRRPKRQETTDKLLAPPNHGYQSRGIL